jgi:putative membrane protein
MKRMFNAAATAVAVCALAGAPAMAQSSASGASGSGQQGSASGSGATDQAGSKPSHGSGEGVTGTSPRGTDHQGGSTAGTSGQSGTSSAASGKASASDRAFVAKAAAGGMAEVKLGQLASEKSTNADVKKFGQMMVDDHSKANSQLMQIAQQAQVTAPKDLKPQDQAFYDHLSKMSGEQFDRAYMKHMVEDHQKDVAEFKKASTTATDSSVKQFATDTLPVLQKHLQDAQDVNKKVGGDAAATSGTTSSNHTGSTGTAASGTSGTHGTAGHHGSGSGTESGSGTGSGSSGSTPPTPPQR